MPRYIDADNVLETMRSNMDMQELYLPIHFIDFVIDEMPTANVQLVRHGRWEGYRSIIGDYFKCSECGNHANVPTCMGESIFDFCPYCGAKMDGEEANK